MGNRQHAHSDDFHKMITEMRKDQSRRVSINPEKKYLSLMKDSLDSTKLPESLKRLILITLEEKVSQVELIETVTCINALRNNEFQSSISRSGSALKDKPESKFVRVNFGEGFLQKILRKFPLREKEEEDHIHTSPSMKERERVNRTLHGSAKGQEAQLERKDRLRIISMVMKKQLNRMIHPFGKLNKAFAEYIEGDSEQFAPPQAKEEQYERSVQRLVNDWCTYLETACLFPYKKWIMGYTQLEQSKYAQWIRNLLIQEIWAANNGYLFGMLTTVIQRCKIPMQIDIKELQESASLLTPSLFSIDPKLQIQGHFFDSIYEMSQVCGRFRPQQILAQLQTVKKRICTDIDNYHRLVQLGQVYEIDSDNILGIVSYILCKIASKIDQIHTHLIFLRILYGDKIYYSMGLGSYMLSTIFGAIEFLESEQFREMLHQKKLKQRQSQSQSKTVKEKEKTSQCSGQAMGQSQTKGETSVQGECSALQVSQSDRRQMQVNSLLQHL